MKGKDSFPNLNKKSPDGIKPGGKRYSVMVVDDKDFHRKQIAQIFESEGYDVVFTAANGKEALQRLEKVSGKIDIVTLALDMPVLDGYAFMHEIKNTTYRPVIVFISEDTTKAVTQDLISMGAADYILKPINRRNILDRVKVAVQRTKAATVQTSS